MVQLSCCSWSAHAKVNDYRSDHELGGLRALKHWRDGRCGEGFPTTWRFLLETVSSVHGHVIAGDLEKSATSNPTWSETSLY